MGLSNTSSNTSFQHVIHDVLKRALCIGKTKAQYLEFRQVKRRHESRVRHYLIVCTLRVTTVEDNCTLQLAEQAINAWQRITVLDSLLINTSEVYVHAQIPSVFLDREHWGDPYGLQLGCISSFANNANNCCKSGRLSMCDLRAGVTTVLEWSCVTEIALKRKFSMQFICKTSLLFWNDPHLFMLTFRMVVLCPYM